MQALILAAGRGTRLGVDHPKCLLDIGGRTLLARYLDVLGGIGLPVSIVIGHRADLVREHVAALALPRPPALLFNDTFERGSILSLACGLAAVDDDLLLLDGDVFFAPSMMTELAAARASALLVDFDHRFTNEEYMAGVIGERVVALRRGPVEDAERAGEWVGFARLERDVASALRQGIATQIARGETGGGYEDALALLLAAHPVWALPVGGRSWTEIDFPEDVARARALAAR